MKRLMLAAAFLSVLSLPAAAPAQAPSAGRAGVAWHEGLDSALKEAKAAHRPVFLDIWAEWCPPCQRMRQQVFPAPQVQAALKKVVAASVMVEKKDRTPIPEGVAVDQKYGTQAYPTLVMLDENGNVLRRHTGALSPAELVKFIAGE